MNKIITHCRIYSSIHILSFNSFDWIAYHEGEEETQHYGCGRTKAEALADLAIMDEELAESMEDASRGLSFARAGDMQPDEGGEL